MKIEQDDIVQKEKKEPKTATIIAILIGVTAIMVIAIIFLIMSRRETKFSVVVDGQTVSMPEDTFIFTNDGKIYVSIRDIAPYVGYEVHDGEYKVDLKDTNKMYIESKNGTDTTSFFLNSATISKVAPNTNDDYENIKIKEPVIKLNDKMYIVAEGFIVGFNSLFSYDQEKNQVAIQTLPSLVQSYTAKLADYGYTELSEDFNNQKALIYGLIIASSDTNKKYGVIDIKGNEILSPRYNNIEFVESTGEFIITNSSNKVGITYTDGKAKISVSYDEIKVMDGTLDLYLVKSNNKYGVINSAEKSIIFLEYDQIGIDSSKFPNDNIKNQYILYDKVIPAKINGKWRLFDINGQKITENEFDEVGFIGSDRSDRVEGNAVTIGETKTIVVGKTENKEKVYGAVDLKGNELIQIRFDQIYSLTSAGKTTYYILYNGSEYDAVEYINAMKQLLGYEEEQSDTTTSGEEENTNTINNNEANNVIENEVANTIEASANTVDTNNINVIEGQ